jgi:hypothetical protein
MTTPLERGGQRSVETRNRFNGFSDAWKTVETVSHRTEAFNSPLKRWVNEKGTSVRDWYEHLFVHAS